MSRLLQPVCCCTSESHQ